MPATTKTTTPTTTEAVMADVAAPALPSDTASLSSDVLGALVGDTQTPLVHWPEQHWLLAVQTAARTRQLDWHVAPLRPLAQQTKDPTVLTQVCSAATSQLWVRVVHSLTSALQRAPCQPAVHVHRQLLAPRSVQVPPLRQRPAGQSLISTHWPAVRRKPEAHELQVVPAAFGRQPVPHVWHNAPVQPVAAGHTQVKLPALLRHEPRTQPPLLLLHSFTSAQLTPVPE